MYVPTSTIDLETATGDDIVIEQRNGDEVYKMWYEKPMAPAGVKTFNPSFDVTDHKYITAVITEKGVVKPPFDVNLKKLMEQKGKLNKSGAYQGAKYFKFNGKVLTDIKDKI